MKLKKMKINCAVIDKSIYCLRPITFPTVTIDQLASDIANATSLSKPDVLSALQSMADMLTARLSAGHICDLGDLGILRVGIKAYAKEEGEGTVNIRKDLKYLRYIFTPREELKNAKKTMTFDVTEITNYADDEGNNIIAE